MSVLSNGPFNYNRFDGIDDSMNSAYRAIYEKKAKPDFLDMDKDGNKKESFKKAVKDKEKGCSKCGKEDCGCEKSVTEGMKPYPAEKVARKREQVKKKEDIHIARGEYDDADKQYKRGVSLAMKTKMKKEEYVSEGMPAGIASGKYGHSPISNSTSKAEKRGTVPTSLTSGKYGTPVSSPPSVKKEDVIHYLIDEGFATNEVSAEVLFNHMSDEWLLQIESSCGSKKMNKKGKY